MKKLFFTTCLSLMVTLSLRAQSSNPAPMPTPAPSSSDKSTAPLAQSPATTPTSFALAPLTEVPQQIDQQLSHFFTNIQNNNTKFAYQDLFKGTQHANETSLLSDFESMTKNTISKYGPLDSFEFLEMHNFGSRLINVSYLTRHKDKFYRWQFIYQANKDTWLLDNIGVDDMRAYLPAYPINQAPPDYVKDKISHFFLTLESGSVDSAFIDITRGSALESSAEQLSAFISKTSSALTTFGNMKYHELLDNRPLGKKLHLLTYLSTLQLQTLRWQFVYTTDADGKWSLLTMRLDDQIAAGIINSN